ncbi:nicotinamide riboside transporter PnuC [Aestuariibacter sp. AA17]|uniref:Nicotinamide riboside transporter PnuC n=1 Tax=Fluctibacter corallii TaxID=2984329 RepID=A0ABT3ABV4_9ALTE|nr:nicotinamide riboside transporter PnuC [Aestuariibacter sp. AA17]MCV2886085.1 nicotinamide riboside transporter PnuC [Aestuariibacter sp. AA17]
MGVVTAEFFTDFVGQLAATSPAEWIAVVLAMAYVWFAAQQNILCWPSALVSNGIYTVIFWSVSLPFHTVLNAYYLVMAIYGWIKWKRAPVEDQAVTTWPVIRHIFCIVALVAVAQSLIWLVGDQLDNAHLQLDALITVFSVFTTVLVAHKVLENWLYWIVIDIAAAYLYFSKGLALTGCLFVIYTAMAVYGYIQWSKTRKQGSHESSATVADNLESTHQTGAN